MQITDDPSWSGIDLLTIPWEDLAEGGILLDVTQAAERRGLLWPVLLSRGLYTTWITPPSALTAFECAEDRIEQVLTHLHLLVRRQMLRLLREDTVPIQVRFLTAPDGTDRFITLAVNFVLGARRRALLVSMPDRFNPFPDYRRTQNR